MGALIKVLFCTVLHLILLMLVEARDEIHEVLKQLGRLLVSGDNLDNCMSLNRSHPDQDDMNRFNQGCTDAFKGFNLLIENEDVPSGWRNPCVRALSPMCRKLNDNGRYRCSVKVFRESSNPWERGGAHSVSLRSCAEGLIVPSLLVEAKDEKREVLEQLGRLLVSGDNLDNCMSLNRNNPDQDDMSSFNQGCRNALRGFNLLVESDDKPSGWKNPCVGALSPMCRKLSNRGGYRCSVEVYRVPSNPWRKGGTEYVSLRSCAVGLAVG